MNIDVVINKNNDSNYQKVAKTFSTQIDGLINDNTKFHQHGCKDSNYVIELIASLVNYKTLTIYNEAVSIAKLQDLFGSTITTPCDNQFIVVPFDDVKEQFMNCLMLIIKFYGFIKKICYYSKQEFTFSPIKNYSTMDILHEYSVDNILKLSGITTPLNDILLLCSGLPYSNHDIFFSIDTIKTILTNLVTPSDIVDYLSNFDLASFIIEQKDRVFFLNRQSKYILTGDGVIKKSEDFFSVLQPYDLYVFVDNDLIIGSLYKKTDYEEHEFCIIDDHTYLALGNYYKAINYMARIIYRGIYGDAFGEVLGLSTDTVHSIRNEMSSFTGYVPVMTDQFNINSIKMNKPLFHLDIDKLKSLLGFKILSRKLALLKKNV